ncbi:MAG: DinB family protein [Pirellulales bacterium]|nr:DinB family protein [Pirellulales bacterium]
MNRLELALQQISEVRAYSTRVLDEADPADWFRQPTEGVTHLAWQVGHMAMAQYRLALVQVRGPQADDERLIPTSYVTIFGRGSVPVADATQYPTPQQLRAVFDAVHEQVLAEAPTFDDALLDEPPHHPHPLFNTRFGALLWCARHEMVHVGQIGLLKRLFGAAATW